MHGCPVICSDEIKQGMVYVGPAYKTRLDDPVNRRTLTAFFDVLAGPATRWIHPCRP